MSRPSDHGRDRGQSHRRPQSGGDDGPGLSGPRQCRGPGGRDERHRGA
ncbi:hypothetical protein [Streptomyces sp. ALI-76-A]|nr:hypothetical protein [Streptomyces sp. ALI-76-A]MDL5199283.1 hypothetical protein [Streptomyces sp. ALI-76-A]